MYNSIFITQRYFSYTETDAVEVGARRLFDLPHLFRQILNGERHAPFDCTIANMKIIKEIRHGLHSEFVLQCKMCLIIRHITNEDKSESLNSNSAIVLGSISTGIGYTQVNELAASLNMPLMSSKTFNLYHESVAGIVRESLTKSMEDAAAEELS